MQTRVCRFGAVEVKLGTWPRSTQSQRSVAVHLSSESAHRQYLASDAVCLICLCMIGLDKQGHLSKGVLSLGLMRAEWYRVLDG